MAFDITSYILGKKSAGGGGGGGTLLFEETVTTADHGSGAYDAELDYSSFISADTIVVTVNGTEYTLQKMADTGANYYGGWSRQGVGVSPDFSEYSFGIASIYDGDNYTNFFITETAGTYTVKAETA